MQRAKSIDEIYEEVKDHDLVITNDAALSTALNGRVDVPRIGGFAYTPRHIAMNEAVTVLGTNVWGDLKLISSIAEDTGYDIKFIHSELENIRTIRRYTLDVMKHIHSKRSKNIYEMFIRLPSLERVMGSYDTERSEFFKGKRVAVIGIELFDDLDKHFIPVRCDEIEIFTEGDYGIDIIHEIGNDRQLAENAIDLIGPEMANDTAIIMDTGGAIADAVRASLYRKKMPFRNTVSVKDLSQVRDFLQYLTLGLSYDTLRVRHIRELFLSYRGHISHKFDEYLFYKLIDTFEGRTKELAYVMRDLRELTFTEVNERIVGKEHRSQIKIVIDDLGISDSLVSVKLVNELVYAVNNINDLHHNEEIPDDEKKGVLLVDCRRSIYVDRPFVIYLGLGPEWSGNNVRKDYIDREDEAERNMIGFTALLQQGSSRFYCVNSMRSGRESVPSPIFDQIFERGSSSKDRKIASSFTDVCKELKKGRWYTPERNELPMIDEEIFDDSAKNEWKFSKSSFDLYFKCPRAYMFGELIHGADSDSTMFGNLMHEFAELYLCYPDVVKKNYERCLEIAKERYSGLSSAQLKRIDDSKIRICTMNMMRFIDSLNISDVPLDMDHSRRKYKNSFIEGFGLERYSSITEARLDSDVHPLFGSMDLVSGKRIIDYKTGKSQDLKKISEGMDISLNLDHYEFQPMVYLSLLRDNGSTPSCDFDLFFVNDNNVRSVTDPEFKIEDNIRSVRLLDISLEEYISSNEFSQNIMIAKTHENIREGWSGFVNVLLSYGLDGCKEWENNYGLISSLLSTLGMNDNKTNRGKISSGLKKIYKTIKSGILIIDGKVVIPSDTLERFLSVVDGFHLKASSEVRSSFPAEPRGDCRLCNYFKACTRPSESLNEESGPDD